jgi:hypothetical protein
MSTISTFLDWLKSNKDALTLVGGFMAAICAGGFALFKYRKERERTRDTAVQPSGVSQGPQDRSFVTQLKLWADIDAEVYVDGHKLMTIDHRSGFDYAASRVRITPESTLSIKARGVERNQRLWELCRSQAEACEVRVGTAQSCDISLTDAEKRASMGSALDVPGLLHEVRDNSNSSARAWAIERLGYIGDMRARDAIVGALDDPDPWVQATAASALGHLADTTVLPELVAAFARYQRKDSYGYIFERAIKDLEFAGRGQRET